MAKGITTPAKVKATLAWIERRGSKKNREGMARYGIVARNVAGVSVGDLRGYAKIIGRDHELALALWETDVYEARMLVPFIADPARVTPGLMDRWARGFDNWAICDGLCFHLFDKTAYAYSKPEKWAGSKHEFVKRAAFALIASVALHHKKAPDQPFRKFLPLIERAARDERNFVKKGVSWALRGIGHRNPTMKAEALAVARRLAQSSNATERWIGRDAMKDLSRPARR